MTPETIATLLASFGAIMAALFGIYKASSAGGKSLSDDQPRPATSDLPNLVTRYLELLTEIGRNLATATATLHEIRRVMEGSSTRQDRMVSQVEQIGRSVERMEDMQSQTAQKMGAVASQADMQLQVMTQVREEVKNLGRDTHGFSHRQRTD
jgi:chromosome segregation ATPase